MIRKISFFNFHESVNVCVLVHTCMCKSVCGFLRYLDIWVSQKLTSDTGYLVNLFPRGIQPQWARPHEKDQSISVCADWPHSCGGFVSESSSAVHTTTWHAWLCSLQTGLAAIRGGACPDPPELWGWKHASEMGFHFSCARITYLYMCTFIQCGLYIYNWFYQHPIVCSQTHLRQN